MKRVTLFGVLLGLVGGVFAQALKPSDSLPPVMRVSDLTAEERPVEVASTAKTTQQNAYFSRVTTEFTFTNPNGRALRGDFEFPIPTDAVVCGYRLEINGERVPGVVCEKEKARVAFENEMRRQVDPGLVEQVKGNIWRTRIFPLAPRTPRHAEVDYVAPKAAVKDEGTIYERDGDDWFAAAVSAGERVPSVAARVAAFTTGTILWDASLSRLDTIALDRARLADNLPETGDWTLIVFSNEPSAPQKFSTRVNLLAAVDAVVYDGGTDLAAALSVVDKNAPKLLFTDEVDTLSEAPMNLEADASIVLASRPDETPRAVRVWKLTNDEKAALKTVPCESTLLATVWVARRMSDLAVQADARGEEFLALGRRYGVAGPGLSLLVLENLDQWLQYKIEPPATLRIHDEWVKRRAAEDDAISLKEAKAEREQQLLRYWKERVEWWKNPIPIERTPQSGLFDSLSDGALHANSREVSFAANESAQDLEMEEAPEPQTDRVGAARETVNSAVRRSGLSGVRASGGISARGAVKMSASYREDMSEQSAPETPGATVTLKPWNPETPYLKALDAAAKGTAYAAYLKQRTDYRSSPAFYLDCAGWFFKADEAVMARRIISNLAEFKLEDAALWRSMGWRLREAGSYDEAVRAFRKALALRPEEAQSRRDLALVLSERGKARMAAEDLSAAMTLLAEAAFEPAARRSGRGGNDLQTAVLALEELNGLIAWTAAQGEALKAVRVPTFDEVYRRDLPVKLRIVLSWDADETDIDLHVLEPNGEEAFYGHRRTRNGGFVSEDVTTGYGPEEYLKKDLESGVYKILSNYFASHQTSLTGATTLSVTIYTDWGMKTEKRQILTLRLDKPRNKCLIGEVAL